MRYVRAFGRFWWDFIVGDTPEIAVGAAVVLALAFAIHSDARVASIVLPVAVAALVIGSVLRAVAASRPRSGGEPGPDAGADRSRGPQDP